MNHDDIRAQRLLCMLAYDHPFEKIARPIIMRAADIEERTGRDMSDRFPYGLALWLNDRADAWKQKQASKPREKRARRYLSKGWKNAFDGPKQSITIASFLNHLER